MNTKKTEKLLDSIISNANKLKNNLKNLKSGDEWVEKDIKEIEDKLDNLLFALEF